MDNQSIFKEPTLVVCEGAAESVIFELLLTKGKTDHTHRFPY